MTTGDLAPPVVDDKRIVRGDTRRIAILAAATRAFGRKGYDGARVADIARAAKVTDAGVLHHFQTKRALFLAVVEMREDVYREMYSADFDSVRDLFEAAISAVKRASEDPDLVRFRHMLTGAASIEGHPIEGRYRDNLVHALDRFIPVVQLGIETGELKPDVGAQQVVLELLALNEGIRDQWVTLPERIDYPTTFAAAAKSLYCRIAVSPLD